MFNKRVKETYNQLASDYEHRVDTNNVYNVDYERPAMMKQLPNNMNGIKVLDAGCAAGWYTEELSKLGAEVIAIDISPEMVAATKRRVGKGVEVFCLNLEEKLPFDDASFDYIVSSLVLHYIEDWGQVFCEFKRLLKSNGIFLFSTHHPFMDIKLVENNDYFSTALIIDQWRRGNKTIDVPFYRRPMHAILNKTLTYFRIENVIEPQPTEHFERKNPDKYERLMKSPHFLIVKAAK